MSIFSRIKDSIFGKAQVAPAPAAPAAAVATPVAAPTVSTAPVAISNVDVAAILDAELAAKGSDLNWRHSIVDLMKLLDLDSSLTERKALAAELGYAGDTNDSAAMNIWLHRQVMTKLAANGGEVPADLRD